MDRQTREIIKFVRDMQGGTDKFKNRDNLSGQYRQEELLRKQNIKIKGKG